MKNVEKPLGSRSRFASRADRLVCQIWVRPDGRVQLAVGVGVLAALLREAIMSFQIRRPPDGQHGAVRGVDDPSRFSSSGEEDRWRY